MNKCFLNTTETERPLSRSNSNTSLSGLGLSTQPMMGLDMAPLTMGPIKLEDKERRALAVQILKTLCEAPVLSPCLLQLMTAKYVSHTSVLGYLCSHCLHKDKELQILIDLHFCTKNNSSIVIK